jgi:hypothetical protein
LYRPNDALREKQFRRRAVLEFGIKARVKLAQARLSGGRQTGLEYAVETDPLGQVVLSLAWLRGAIQLLKEVEQALGFANRSLSGTLRHQPKC